MTLEFDQSWSDLNARLEVLEHDSGLASALRELENYHHESGFIRDTLRDVQRYTFHHPDDHERYFRVQYNPRRAQRFAGSGRTNGTEAPLNNGCFLCRENIQWQQDGAQLGYQVESDGRFYHALANPFPLLPAHVVLASREHCPQEWSFRNENGLRTDMLVNDLVTFADRMPGHIVFYNGVDAGASIPGHLHFQCVKRPAGESPFPLEVAAVTQAGLGEPGLLEGYPLDAAVWKGSADDVAMHATAWLLQWAERNQKRLEHLSANLIATRADEADEVVFVFVPRDRNKSKPIGFTGLIGGLEVLGEIVLSSPEDKSRLDAGEIDCVALETILASIHTPMEATPA